MVNQLQGMVEFIVTDPTYSRFWVTWRFIVAAQLYIIDKFRKLYFLPAILEKLLTKGDSKSIHTKFHACITVCISIIILFYYKGKPIQEITKIANTHDEDNSENWPLDYL